MRDARHRLLRAAGTQVLTRRHETAAVGKVFTWPEARGPGFGRAVTAALVAEPLDGICREAILNVAVDNAPARRLYERLGFRVRGRYWEGMAAR